MPKFNWPQVVLILGALATVAILALSHVDTTAIIGLVIALLLGGAFGTLGQVKDQTNGSHTALLNIVAEQSRQLASSTPRDPSEPPVGDQDPKV